MQFTNHILGQSIPNRPNLTAREIPICLEFSTYLENNTKKILPEAFLFIPNSLFLALMQSFGVATPQKRGNSKVIIKSVFSTIIIRLFASKFYHLLNTALFYPV